MPTEPSLGLFWDVSERMALPGFPLLRPVPLCRLPVAVVPVVRLFPWRCLRIRTVVFILFCLLCLALREDFGILLPQWIKSHLHRMILHFHLCHILHYFKILWKELIAHLMVNFVGSTKSFFCGWFYLQAELYQPLQLLSKTVSWAIWYSSNLCIFYNNIIIKKKSQRNLIWIIFLLYVVLQNI